jgi:hypothetical protein
MLMSCVLLTSYTVYTFSMGLKSGLTRISTQSSIHTLILLLMNGVFPLVFFFHLSMLLKVFKFSNNGT